MIEYSRGPEVVLLAQSNNLMMPAKAAVFCTSTRSVDQIMEPSGKDAQVLRNVVERGHESVLEHISFTFGVSGVSRVTETQLVRHRVASYSVKSGRYTRVKDTYECVAPPSILEHKDPRVHARFNYIMEAAHAAYLDLTETFDIPQEDARYLLPQATATQLLVTMNARELNHFFSLRCCGHAQWEIQAVAWKMLTICQEVHPIVFENSGPKCFKNGYCVESESQSCGLKPLKKEVSGG